MVFYIAFVFFNDLSYGLDTGIDRETHVKRHIPKVTAIDSLSPFSVGNGKFAFTTDITGLQTFSEFYKNGIPLATQSEWGWHTVPNINNYSLEQTYEYFETYGRKVPYCSDQNSDAAKWLRANPHKINLGKIGFKIKKQNGSDVKIADIKNINQIEDIWEGVVKSTFEIEENKYEVITACHPELDQIAVKIKSEELQRGNVSIAFNFPYGSTAWGNDPSDWDNPGKHSSEIISRNSNSSLIKRMMDSTIYFVLIEWEGTAEFIETEKHSFVLNISANKQFNFTCSFSAKNDFEKISNSEQTFLAAKDYWKKFWQTGGAIDLSESTDPRARELERRIILSRYLTAIQCAGNLPPAETGLTFNSWYGKFHLEMHWWHTVHFLLWGKPELMEKSLAWYESILPSAKKTAGNQGYTGVRWPKMAGPDGKEGPSSIGVFLIWQQPHPIFYAELLYRYYHQPEIIEKYKDIVFETAEFMASYVQWDKKNNRYVLGPPLIPAQEIYKPDSTINPCYELAYWKYGLQTAQKWRERLGLKRNEKWDDIISHLSALPQKNEYYQNAENALNTFEDSKQRNDHPTLLGAFGILNDEDVDLKMMERTLEEVMATWNWESTWGWDYPLIAMTAARVGRPDLAIDALLMDVQKNTYLPNGHNYQDERLTLYLPGNGGLLIAVAMMAAGWDGAPDIHAPGFPNDGKWVVKYEGLTIYP